VVQSKDPDEFHPIATAQTFLPQNWVPHLRDSFIVAKVGIRATREPL
jgi:hypothetical protein